MSDEAKSNWKENIDLLLKVLSGVLIPVTIVVAGHLVARQQEESNAGFAQTAAGSRTGRAQRRPRRQPAKIFSQR